MTQLTSGLSHHEVIQTAHELKRLAAIRQRFNWNVFSALLFGALVAFLLIVADLRLAVILSGLVLTTALGGFAVSSRHQKNGEVIVVREGLKRLVHVQALVPGDVILLAAGVQVPVDVMTEQPVRLSIWQRALLRLTNAGMNYVPAGARTLEETEATVLAVDRDQLKARFCDDIAEASQVAIAPRATLILAVLTVLHHAIVLPARAVVRTSRRVLKYSVSEFVWVLRRFTQFLRQQAHLWSDALETAFRYHQDPVESPS